MTNYREVWLEINGKQCDKMLKKGSNIESTNYSMQFRVLFAFYVDLEANLEKVQKLIEIILTNLILINIKTIWLVVMDIN